MLDGAIIGSVKGEKQLDTCCIGRLMVHPDHRGKGFGKALMMKIEDFFSGDPHIARFELFTGELSHDNIHLYESLGYRIYKTQPYDADKNIVYMEKQANKKSVR